MKDFITRVYESFPKRTFQMRILKFSLILSLSEEEITSTKNKSESLESLLHRDTSINDSQKIDSLLDEFAGELTLPYSISTENYDVNLDRKVKFILYSDTLMENCHFLDDDDSIPPGIESDDFDSEDDDNSTSRPEFESFHVDYPDSGDSTIDVVEDIPVDVPNILPTHLALQLDFDFIPSNDLRSDHNILPLWR
ncbi:hypothetical protein Tco_1041061 [Tanacetum coccineum]|uniref:Reverse transcriptase domain-containing protein n=1 Tax=Tanacetum coccineum TaxID=301880 RepID=A0ABQ5GGL0_9ASTR